MEAFRDSNSGAVEGSATQDSIPAPARSQDAARGTLQNILANILAFPTGFVVSAFLSRALGPVNYGDFAAANYVISWLETLIPSIFVGATITFVAQAKDWRAPASTAVRFQLVASLSAALALVLAAPTLGSVLGTPSLGLYLRLFAIDIPLTAMTATYFSVLTGREQFGRRAVADSTYWIGRMVFIVILVVMRLSIVGAILGTVCASATRLIVARLFIRVPLFGYGTISIRRFLAYSGASVFFAAVFPLSDKVGLFLVKALDAEPAAAGFYSAAASLVVVPALVAGALAPLITALIAKELVLGNLDGARALINQANRALMLLLPFNGVTAACSTGIVTLVFGTAFAGSAPYFVVLGFASVAWALCAVSSALLLAAGKLRGLIALHGPLVPLLIVGGYFATKYLGGIGAPVAAVGAGTIGALASAILVYRTYGTYVSPRSVLNMGLTCVLILFPGRLWPAPGLMILFKVATLSIAAFGLLFVLRELRSSDVALGRSLLARLLAPSDAPSGRVRKNVS